MSVRSAARLSTALEVRQVRPNSLFRESVCGVREQPRGLRPVPEKPLSGPRILSLTPLSQLALAYRPQP